MSAVSRNKYQILTPTVRQCFSDEKSSNNTSDNEDTKENAQKKLNDLLNVLKVSGANVESEVASAKELDNEVVIATKDVASLSGQRVKTESELVRKLKQLEQETKVAKRDNEVSGENQDSLESVFSDIRIEKPLGKNKQKLKENVEAAKEKSDLSMEQAAFLQKRAKMRRAK